MEVPDKFYVTSDENESFVFTRKRSDGEGAEYVRTDTFIEKACEWIRANWRDYVNVDIDGVVCFGHLEGDFKNYMKTK